METFLNNYLLEEDEIKIAQRLFDEFCEKCYFPKVQVKSVLLQDNSRFLHAIAVPCWATECLQKTGYPHILQRREARPFVREVVREHLLTEYERQYR